MNRDNDGVNAANDHMHFNNPSSQTVCVGLLGASYQQLHNWGRCPNSEYKLESVRWGIKKEGDDSWVTSNNRFTQTWLSNSTGGQILCWTDLEAGTYDIKIGYARLSTGYDSQMNYKVATYCSEASCAVTNDNADA